MKNIDINIGIFEGSNKTYIRIENDQGQLIDNGTSELINLHLSINHAWEMITLGIEKALASTSINLHNEGYNFHVGLGIKYTEMDEAVKKLIQKSKNEKLFKTFTIGSDCYALTLVQKPNHAVIIVDEGIVGNAITKNDFFKVGGWGFPFADKGSILWLGSEAYRYTLQWIEGSLDNPSPLLKAIYSHFNNDTTLLIDWAMKDFLNKKQQYRILSDMVLNYYNRKDCIAVDLMEKSAHEVEKIYKTIKKVTGDENIPLSLYGELVNYITPLLSGDVKKNVHIIHEGAVGAIKLLKLSENQTHGQSIWSMK